MFEKIAEQDPSSSDTLEDEDGSSGELFSSDSKTITFLRFCGKCFARGVDEKSGCYSAFRTFCQSQNEKSMFVNFRGNRFNIIFLMGQIAFYHHQRIKHFFETVHGSCNRLQKLTLSLVKKPYIIASCKVLGLISKLITAPLWRLIESNVHVLDMNNSYHTLLAFFDRASEDSSDFINGNDHPFDSSLIERDEIYVKLVQPSDVIDDNACALAQMAFKGLGGVLRKAMKEQLPGGSFFQPTDEIREHTKSVIPHNKVPERVFGILDFFLRYRPNATTISNEAFLMFAFNKTSEWLQSLPITEKEKLLTECRKEGRQMQAKYKERLKEIEAKRRENLQNKQLALEKKQKRALQVKSKHTNAILYYGLWQRPDDVENILAELSNTEKRKALSSQIRFRQKVLKQTVIDKQLYQMSEKGKAYSLEKLKNNVIQLIKDAADSPSEESPTQEIPLLVGKKVIHTFNEGKWPGRVLSVVAGFPEFYNIVYDCDLQENSSPNAIYTYTLKEDYRNGNLEIVPE
ncbi:hypothetical protein ACJMK2_040610, partial [Sinanodonta woodiana]